MKNKSLEIILYIIISLLLSNVCWYFAYNYMEKVIGMIAMILGSFTSMILALAFVKNFNGDYKKLGFRLNIKKSMENIFNDIYNFNIIIICCGTINAINI